MRRAFPLFVKKEREDLVSNAQNGALLFLKRRVGDEFIFESKMPPARTPAGQSRLKDAL